MRAAAEWKTRGCEGDCPVLVQYERRDGTYGHRVIRAGPVNG